MWRTIEIVPSSIRGDPQVISACEAIDAELRAIYECMGSVPGGILFWPFVDQQVPPLLDMLMWEMHVDVWQNIEGDPLTTEKKQELINESIDWHRHKGTRWVVDQMLKVLFSQGRVTEWYEYGGQPYYFRIAFEGDITGAQFDRILEAVYAVKNVRSWLDTPAFITTRQQQQILYHSAVVTQHITTKVKLANIAPIS
jgi:phage tail P2-like protein